MRKLILLVCAVLLVALMALPASAAILSWEQYIYSYDEDSVTCVIPAANSYITAWNKPGGTVVKETHAASLTWSFPANSQPCFQVWPMGANNRMTLDDIPDGTLLEYTITYNYSATALYGNLISYIAYYDADFNQVSSTILDSGAQTLPKTFNISHTMDFPADAKYFTVWCYLQGWTTLTAANAYGIVCSDLRFTMDIEYLPDDSAILNGINNKLDGIGDQIGDINDSINSGPNSPDGSDIFEDFEQTEDQIMDSVSGGLADIPDLFTDIATNWREYSSAFLAYIRIFEAFAGVSIIPLLLRFSLAFGVVGILVNLGVEGAINADRRSFNQKKALWKRAYDAETRAAPSRIKARGYSQS